jgi:hypothetical protein
VLQLLWWAGGGDPEEFPLSVLDDTELNAEDTRDFLRNVFDEQPIDDESFWGRLADRIDFEMLTGVGEVHSSENLNRLMKPLAKKLTLSHAAIDRDDRLPLHGGFSWALSDQFLQLLGDGWMCKLTPLGNRFSQRRGEGSPIQLRTARDRSGPYAVAEAELEEFTRRVHLIRTEETEPRPATTLDALTEGFSEESHVRRLVIRVKNQNLSADFDRMLLASEPDSSVTLMATTATRLLLSLANDERARLDSFLGVQPF